MGQAYCSVVRLLLADSHAERWVVVGRLVQDDDAERRASGMEAVEPSYNGPS